MQRRRSGERVESRTSERTLSDALQDLSREGDLLQRYAAEEGTVSDALDALGNCYRLQSAATEALATDGLQTVSEQDGLEHPAAAEGSVLKAHQATRGAEVREAQTGAGAESIDTDAPDARGQCQSPNPCAREAAIVQHQ